MEAANSVEGYDPEILRKDACGTWIKYDDYNSKGEYGWVIDHVYPIFKLKNLKAPEKLWNDPIISVPYTGKTI